MTLIWLIFADQKRLISGNQRWNLRHQRAISYMRLPLIYTIDEAIRIEVEQIAMTNH
jgi:hypothetical protein